MTGWAVIRIGGITGDCPCDCLSESHTLWVCAEGIEEQAERYIGYVDAGVVLQLFVEVVEAVLSQKIGDIQLVFVAAVCHWFDPICG